MKAARVGNDIQSLSELRTKIGVLGSRAIFTDYERAYCAAKREPWVSFGGILCAKEACIKVLSSFEGVPRYTFPDLEILHSPAGRPTVCARTRLSRWMTCLGIHIDVAISHSGEYAMATALCAQR